MGLHLLSDGHRVLRPVHHNAPRSTLQSSSPNAKVRCTHRGQTVIDGASATHFVSPQTSHDRWRARRMATRRGAGIERAPLSTSFAPFPASASITTIDAHHPHSDTPASSPAPTRWFWHIKHDSRPNHAGIFVTHTEFRKSSGRQLGRPYRDGVPTRLPRQTSRHKSRSKTYRPYNRSCPRIPRMHCIRESRQPPHCSKPV